MTQFNETKALKKVEFDEVTDISESLSEAVLSNHQKPSAKSIFSEEKTFKSSPKILDLRGPIPSDMSGDDSDPEPPVEENMPAEQDPDPIEILIGNLDGNSGEGQGEDIEVLSEEGPGEDIETLNGEEIEKVEGEDTFRSPPPCLMPGPITTGTESDQDPSSVGPGSINMADEQDGDEALGDDSLSQGGPLGPMEGPQPLPRPQMHSPVGDDDDDDDDDVQAPLPEGSYDPRDYEHLDVPPELKELFTYISKYTPQNIELEHKLRPYIPDYIPAVGDIDAFVKIPRPDDESSSIGLTVLDEPSAKQSDSTVLDLQLRAVAKHTTARSVVVKTVENAEKNSKVIEKWMRDISDLHRAKPPPTVHYSKRMPDIDSLMQEWPGEIEDLLKEINLPSAALQVELSHYVDLICSILDIPVYKSRIQSLHVLFTLFSVFKNSAHFRHLVDENNTENEETSGGADRLVL